MSIRFEDITDQQCVDIIAHFVERKGVDEIIIHTKNDDIVITKRHKVENLDDSSVFDVAGVTGCLII